METGMRVGKWLWSIMVLMLVASCAQQVRPTGGPKDETPPKVLQSDPLNFSTGFDQQKIELEFDEFVQQKGLNKELIVSPPLKHEPIFKMKGRSIEMEIIDTLLPNTTYTINFGGGIVDITEFNPLDSNIFVFSTGTYLDSGIVIGQVKKAFDLSPVEGLLVMLYDNLADSVPTKERPTYFTRTKENGSFRINYIKDGQFQLFVLKDNNSNYLFDQPNEAIAFHPLPVNPKGADTVLLHVFEEDAEKQYLKSAKVINAGMIQFIFNRPLTQARITPLGNKLNDNWFEKELHSEEDTLVYWLPKSIGVDTLELEIADDTAILDTVELVIPDTNTSGGSKKAKLKKKKNQPQLTVKLNANNQGFDFYKQAAILTNHPIRSFDASKVVFAVGKDTLAPSEFSFKQEYKHVLLEHPLKEETSYQMTLFPGAVQDLFGLTNDTLVRKFKTKEIADYGRLAFKVVPPQKGHQFIVQLMDKDEKVVEERIITGSKTLEFPYLDPMLYRVKLIHDRNNNGKWDTGSYGNKLQPEKVVYYSGKLEIRANWDLELNWKLN